MLAELNKLVSKLDERRKPVHMKMMKDRQLGHPSSCKAPPDAPMWAVCSVHQDNGRSVFFFGSS